MKSAAESGHTSERAEFLAAMRRVVSSVTVVSTRNPQSEQTVAATVSSFTSVSADPPTVVVCLRDSSLVAASVLASGWFDVSVLPQTGRVLAERFAGHHDAALLDRCADRFDGLPAESGAAGRGLLPATEGVTLFTCRVTRQILEATHRVILAHVESTRVGDARPLAWLDGAFHECTPVPDSVNASDSITAARLPGTDHMSVSRASGRRILPSRSALE